MLLANICICDQTSFIWNAKASKILQKFSLPFLSSKTFNKTWIWACQGQDVASVKTRAVVCVKTLWQHKQFQMGISQTIFAKKFFVAPLPLKLKKS